MPINPRMNLFGKQRNLEARRAYKKLVDHEMKQAVHTQTLDGTGADNFVHWARSHDGRAICKHAGIEPKEHEFERMKKEILHRAKRNQIDLFGKRRSKETILNRSPSLAILFK